MDQRTTEIPANRKSKTTDSGIGYIKEQKTPKSLKQLVHCSVKRSFRLEKNERLIGLRRLRSSFSRWAPAFGSPGPRAPQRAADRSNKKMGRGAREKNGRLVVFVCQTYFVCGDMKQSLKIWVACPVFLRNRTRPKWRGQSAPKMTHSY